MRRAADQLGLQLLFTAAPKDKGALSMFDRTIALGRKTRPSSKEKVVVIDDSTREITDLLLIQKTSLRCSADDHDRPQRAHHRAGPRSAAGAATPTKWR